MDHERNDVLARMYADSVLLRGVDLEDLGYLPEPEELGAENRDGREAEDLEWMASQSPEYRAESGRRARLLAGALWHSSVVLVDQLFEDVATLRGLETITVEDLAGTWVLSDLPRRHRSGYTVQFAQRFLVAAAEMTGQLVSGWVSPNCVAQELAVWCLINQLDVTRDLYELDLDPHWRGMLVELLLEDTDSAMLYDPSMDGFEDDVELNRELGLAPMDISDWFEPFNEGSHVAPYVR